MGNIIFCSRVMPHRGVRAGGYILFLLRGSCARDSRQPGKC